MPQDKFCHLSFSLLLIFSNRSSSLLRPHRQKADLVEIEIKTFQRCRHRRQRWIQQGFVHVIKLFFTCQQAKKARVFDPGEPSQSSLIFFALRMT